MIVSYGDGLMTEKRYVEELWAYDDIMVKDNESGEELWNNMIYERMNKQDEQIKELKIELQNKTEKWKYELGMKLKYHSKLIDSEKDNEQLKKELIKFKEWEKYIGGVKREELDAVFKMSIFEIAEGFEYYKKRIKELEDVIKND